MNPNRYDPNLDDSASEAEDDVADDDFVSALFSDVSDVSDDSEDSDKD